MLNDTGRTGGSDAVVHGGGSRVSRKLEKVAAKWKKHLKDAGRGALIVACEVVDLANDWDDDVARELGHASYTSWLKATLGHHLKYFADRARAIKLLGPHARNVYEHNAAVHVANIVPERKRIELEEACLAEWATCGGPVGHHTSRVEDRLPLSLDKVEVVKARLWGEQPEKRSTVACGKCAKWQAEAGRLRALLAQHGIEVE